MIVVWFLAKVQLEQEKHAIGTARKQINLETNEIREGGGLQILFEEFDPSWIIQTKRIGN